VPTGHSAALGHSTAAAGGTAGASTSTGPGSVQGAGADGTATGGAGGGASTASTSAGAGAGKEQQPAAGGGGGATDIRYDSPHSGGAAVTPSEGSQRRRELIGVMRASLSMDGRVDLSNHNRPGDGVPNNSSEAAAGGVRAVVLAPIITNTAHPAPVGTQGGGSYFLTAEPPSPR
jgi:hypothetical protein